MTEQGRQKNGGKKRKDQAEKPEKNPRDFRGTKRRPSRSMRGWVRTSAFSRSSVARAFGFSLEAEGLRGDVASKMGPFKVNCANGGIGRIAGGA